jgi:hypothetical protein
MSEILSLSGETNSESKKKGRKPKQTNYFDIREEIAVVNYLSTDDYYEKNKMWLQNN